LRKRFAYLDLLRFVERGGEFGRKRDGGGERRWDPAPFAKQRLWYFVNVELEEKGFFICYILDIGDALWIRIAGLFNFDVENPIPGHAIETSPERKF
jgi:hypothetical protein